MPVEVEGLPADGGEGWRDRPAAAQRPHRLGSALNARAMNARLSGRRPTAVLRVSCTGEAASARAPVRVLRFEQANPPIASVLPSALTVRSTRARLAPGSRAPSIRVTGAGGPAAGSPAVLARLAEPLFIEAVRRHVASLPRDQRGWIAGLRDPVVGRALALVHGRTAHRWTVAGLAREAGASRSAFADRFTSLIGESPCATSRGSACGGGRALAGGPAIPRGVRCRLRSEAAFSRAFKREFGKSPAAWRRA